MAVDKEMKSFKRYIAESTAPKLLEFHESSVHGMGVFITENTPVHAPIGLYLQSLRTGHNDWIRSDIARLINHSTTPNLNVQEHNGDLYVVANRNIEKDEELFTNYFEVAKIAQPREIVKDSFVRLYPEIDESHLVDMDIEFYEDLKNLKTV